MLKATKFELIHLDEQVTIADFHLPQSRGSQPVVSFASVKPHPLREFFHVTPRPKLPGMGSMPRRERREREERERAALQPALNCQACGALAPGERFRYYCDQIICDACGTRNPSTRRTMVPRYWLLPRNIEVNIVPRDGYSVQAMDLDRRTMLGPYVRAASKDTLRRLLAYLGATPDQLADLSQTLRNRGQGTTQITLQPGRKNLLRIDCGKL